MKFSTYYKIQNRDAYLQKYANRLITYKNEAYKEMLYEKLYELMELIVKMILDEDINSLNLLLSKSNAKTARLMFDHFSGLKIKNIKKAKIKQALIEFFNKENDMKSLKTFIEERVKPIKLTNMKYKPFRLNEEDEMNDDPFADDAGGDDTGGDDNLFGDDASSNDSGNTTGDDGTTDDTKKPEEKDEDEDKLDLEGHDDDPDFKEGKKSSDNVILGDEPAGECIYDKDGVMQSIKATEHVLSEDQMKMFKPVKKAVTLIFNGKLLKPEDVTFENAKNAAFIIKQICKNLDDLTANYLTLKIKQPLLQIRDKNKEDIADMKNDTDSVRDTINSLN